MQDIRDTLNRVPVVFATLDNHFSFAEYTFLSFAMEGNWEKPVYLFDALTGDSIRIMDGMQIAVETPIPPRRRIHPPQAQTLVGAEMKKTPIVAFFFGTFIFFSYLCSNNREKGENGGLGVLQMAMASAENRVAGNRDLSCHDDYPIAGAVVGFARHP